MLLKLYLKFSPLLAAFFIFTSTVFFVMCVWRGEIILGLQAELIKDNNKEFKIVLEQHEAANKISNDFAVRETEREKEKEYVIKTVEKIITVPVYSNICFDDVGLHQLNSQIAAINGAGKPESAVSANQGAN